MTEERNKEKTKDPYEAYKKLISPSKAVSSPKPEKKK